jgi:hypothetical protein
VGSRGPRRLLRFPVNVVNRGAGHLTIGSLTIANEAGLDLGNHDLHMTGAIPAETIRSWLLLGFANGAWNGQGICSSAAALVAADSSNPHKTALGYWPGAMSVIRYTFGGDANLDGVVNALDFNALASNFGAGAADWTAGDFNYDGKVDSLDFQSLAINFGVTSASSPLAAILVPEPGFAGAILVAIFYRRRGS